MAKPKAVKPPKGRLDQKQLVEIMQAFASRDILPSPYLLKGLAGVSGQNVPTLEILYEDEAAKMGKDGDPFGPLSGIRG